MKGIRRNTKDGYEITIYDRRYGTVHLYHDKQGKRLTELKYTIGVRGKILDEIETGIFDPDYYTPQKAVALQFDNAILQWLDDIEVAPSTYKKYRNDISNKIIPHFKDTNVIDIRARDIKKFHKSLKVAAKTRNNIMSILRKFFKSLQHDEIITTIPNFPEWQKIEYKYRKPCSWEVFLDVLDAIPDLMVVEGILTMRLEWLRPNELRALRWEDILFDEDRIIVRNSFSGNVFRETTKTDDWGSIHLHSVVKELLIKRKGHPKGFVFHIKGKPFYESKIDKVFSKARDAKGYSKELNPYGSTRHSAATEGYRDTQDIYAVKKGLRHRHLSATLKYTHEDSTKEIIEPKGKVFNFKRRLSEK